jgi:spermidine synthase
MQARLSSPEGARVSQSLSEVGLSSAISLMSTYGGQARDLAPWLADAQINRDANLRLQYLAGLGLNRYESASIYDGMLKYRSYPENLFVGTDSEKELLRSLLQNPGNLE